MEKKRGRPPKPDDERADERLELRLTAQEKSAWQAAAEKDGISLAEWVRAKLNRVVSQRPRRGNGK